MEEYKYRKIDAFTEGKSLGNPAACIFLNEKQSLSDSDMLSIARQHKGFVSEVVYCVPQTQSSFHLTYYSSECEVDFCGHGTIACMYNLLKETPFLLNQKEIVVHTNKKGSLTVYNEIAEKDSIYITAPIPQYIGTNLNADDIAKILLLSTNQISTSYPIEMIDAGLRTLIVPIAALSDEINIFPNEHDLKAFCLHNEIDIVLTFSVETDKEENIAHTRVFAPKFGYLEDPATGSGNSAFGYYTRKNSMWNGESTTVEQGGADRIFNAINLLYKDDHLLFGGKATTRIKGVYCL